MTVLLLQVAPRVPKDVNSLFTQHLIISIMKTKVLSLIAISAVVALSFAFTSSSKHTAKKATKEMSSKNQDAEPLGGLISEDKY